MAWIRTVPEEESQGRLRETYALVQEARGVVANLHRAQSLRPEALRAQVDLHMALLHSEGGLSRREREMVGLVVSAHLKSNYTLTHHADAAGRFVTEPGVVPMLAADHEQAMISARERAILDHAVKLTDEPANVTGEDVEKLRDHGLKDEEILDLTLLTGYINYVARVALGLGVEPDDVAKPYKY